MQKNEIFFRREGVENIDHKSSNIFWDPDHPT